MTVIERSRDRRWTGVQKVTALLCTASRPHHATRRHAHAFSVNTVHHDHRSPRSGQRISVRVYDGHHSELPPHGNASSRHTHCKFLDCVTHSLSTPPLHRSRLARLVSASLHSSGCTHGLCASASRSPSAPLHPRLYFLGAAAEAVDLAFASLCSASFQFTTVQICFRYSARAGPYK